MRQERADAFSNRSAVIKAAARMAGHINGMRCERCATAASVYSVTGGYLCGSCNEHRHVDAAIADMKERKRRMQKGR